MSSYAQRGMSLRAVEAYEDGRVPLSKVDRSRLDRAGLDFSVGFAKWILGNAHFTRRREWHHTGKFANETTFYDLESLADYWREEISGDDRVRLNEAWLKSKKPPEKTPPVEVVGRYHEWQGSRNHGGFVPVGFSGIMENGWIRTKAGVRKKADGKHIEWKVKTK